jgi:hypothetical protein
MFILASSGVLELLDNKTILAPYTVSQALGYRFEPPALELYPLMGPFLSRVITACPSPVAFGTNPVKLTDRTFMDY